MRSIVRYYRWVNSHPRLHFCFTLFVVSFSLATALCVDWYWGKIFFLLYPVLYIDRGIEFIQGRAKAALEKSSFD